MTEKNIPIQRVIKCGRWFRFEHLQGKRFIILAIYNAGMTAWALLNPWPYKLFSILSVAALTLSVVLLIKANIVTMPDWAKDAWEDLS